MCGIAGIISRNGSPPIEVLEMMLNTLAHRGPDHRGTHQSGPVALGHTRLSIIDLSSRGHQPMVDPSGRWGITYNGEIYNFLTLREALLSDGVKFRSASDTEVLLHWLISKGQAGLRDLEGMFAIALYDFEEGTLMLARDRFGVKPLYYADMGKRFLFASEIKALLAAGVAKDLDYQALASYFRINYIAGRRTAFKRVSRLAPGYLLRLDRQGWHWELQCWYDHSERLFQGHERTVPYGEACNLLRNVVQEAVRKRLISDVPLGAFLSGGIDSSIVVAVMATIHDGPVRTFSIGYPDSPMFDEAAYADEVAKRYSTRHTLINLDQREVAQAIPTVLDHIDEPFGDPSIIPTYLVSHFTRKHVKVALSGDGADEVFGGYDKYYGEYLARHMKRVPASVMNLFWRISDLLPATHDTFVGNLNRQLRKLRAGLLPCQWERHHCWMQLCPERYVSDLYNFKEVIDDPTKKLVRLRQEAYRGEDDINRMLFTDVGLCLPYDMLSKVDTASMMCSLEVRSPFMDHHVIELAFSFQGSYKLKGVHRKKILIDAFADLLPAKIRRRGKQGFDIPLGKWFKEDLREMFWDMFSERSQPGGGILRRDIIKKIYDEHLNLVNDHSRLLWNLFVFQWWFNRVFG